MALPAVAVPGFCRRDWLAALPFGLGATALAATGESLSPRPPGHPARARRLVHLFMNGGPSQVDTFDPKPRLDGLHGKPVPETSLRTERKTAGIMRSPFKFRKYGQSGLEISELFDKTASRHADRMCVIRSLHAEVPNHEPSLMLMNTGDGRLPRPCLGSWLLYGLGTEGGNLPAFVVLCPGGLPVVGVQKDRKSVV